MESVSHNSALKSAIVDQDLDKVKEFLTQQSLAECNEINHDLLNAAVEVENVGIVKLLLKHGCAVTTSKSNTSHLPLCHAVQSENLEMIRVLLAAGAPITEKDSHCQETPLQRAFNLALDDKNFKTVDLMLSAYNVESINLQNENGIILFYIACIRNKTNLVESFIERGININICLDHKNNYWNGSTALHYAVKYQCLEVIELLLEKKADVLYQNLNTKSPLHLAFLHLMSECNDEYARDKAEEIIDLILSAHQDEFTNPTDSEHGISHFHIACMRNNISVVEKYIEIGVDVNGSVNCNDNMFYSWFQNTPLHFVAMSHKKDIISLLIEHGANVNATNGHGLTPLWILLENQPKYRKIKKFIKFCKSKDKLQNSENPLIDLIVDEFEYIECITLLVEAGSNLNYKDEYGKPLLFKVYDTTVNSFLDRQDILGTQIDDLSTVCTEYFLDVLDKTFHILKRHEIDLESRDVHGNSIFHHIAHSIKNTEVSCVATKTAEIMLSSSIDPNVQNGKGEIPINIACAIGSLEFVSLLLKSNVNPNCVDKMLHTPVDVACINHDVDDKLRFKMIDLLVVHGANLNNRNADGETVLFKTVRSNYLSSMKSILETNCYIDAQNKAGETALFVAVLQNNRQATKLLLDHGADVNIKDYSGTSLMEKLFMRNVYIDYIKETYLPVLEILEMHVRKLKVTNYFVSHCNLVNCKRLKFAYVYHPHVSLVSGLFQDEKDLELDVTDKDRRMIAELNEELTRMKATQIGDTCLFDVLFRNSREKTRYLKNNDFQKCILQELQCSQFPYFKDWISVKYQQGLARLAYTDDALKSLKCIISKNFPDMCLHNITLYLSNSDLKNLISVNS